MLLTEDAFRRLCRARDLLGELDEHSPSVKSVATQLGVSHFHFIRRFEAVFGSTPHQFRIHSRLELAKELLALGELSVTEVCMQVGLSSLGSFSDLFTRRVGMSPSTFRRRERTLVQVPGSLERAWRGCLGAMALLPESMRRNFREASARDRA